MRSQRHFTQARKSLLLDEFRLFSSISIVALMIVLVATVNGWGAKEAVSIVSEAATSAVPCSKFDRWAPRKAEYNQFLACVASVVGLQTYNPENLSITNEWVKKHGQVLALHHLKESSSCSITTEVWYLDRRTMKVVESDIQYLVC